MGIYSSKQKWQQFFQPIVDFCVARRIHPDVFTYGALVLAGTAALAFLLAGSDHRWLWLAPLPMLLRLVFNVFDGQIARKLEIADAWGEVKNEVADRVADSLIFGGLLFGGYADVRLVAVLLVLVLISSYVGVLGKAVGAGRVYAGVFAKGDRMITLALFTPYPAWSGHVQSYNYYLGAAVLATIITLVQRLHIIHVWHSQSA